MAMKISNIEQEIIILKADKEIIDTMVNYEMMSLVGADPNSSIRFKSSTHQKFFNIVLVDFLSRTDRKSPIKQTSYLGAMKDISEDPSFNVGDSIKPLRGATQGFIDWLDQEVKVNVWLPSIDTQTTLDISRKSFLKMCGNISKHNFLRSFRVAEDLQKNLAKNGVSVTIEESLLALADFYERFHTDILNYHGSTIAEFLNNIRWGIYEYLQPEFHSSIVWESGDPPKYRYRYPNAVTSRLAKECYWELMNEVHSAPYMRKFTVTKSLKSRY
jgi:hypothetical protein